MRDNTLRSIIFDGQQAGYIHLEGAAEVGAPDSGFFDLGADHPIFIVDRIFLSGIFIPGESTVLPRRLEIGYVAVAPAPPVVVHTFILGGVSDVMGGFVNMAVDTMFLIPAGQPFYALIDDIALNEHLYVNFSGTEYPAAAPTPAP